VSKAESESARYKTRHRRTYNITQAMTKGECLNFNAAPKPRKGRCLTRHLTAFLHSSFHSSLVPGYAATPYQGWPSTHRPLNPWGGEGRGCRAA